MAGDGRPSATLVKVTPVRGRHPIAECRAALAMLTRIPIRGVPADSTGATAFGVVGAIIGGLASVPLLVMGGLEPALGAIAAVAVLAVVSGALHLDGLADTADALLAADPARAEAAREDPTTGVGGVTAIVLVLGAEVAALASLAADPGPAFAALACIAAATVSRAIAVPVTRLARARVGPDGLAAWFAARVGRLDAIVAIVSAAVIVAGLTAIATVALSSTPLGFAGGVVIGVALGLGAAGAIVALRGRLDGDGIGASIELTQAAVLVAMATISSVA